MASLSIVIVAALLVGLSSANDPFNVLESNVSDSTVTPETSDPATTEQVQTTSPASPATTEQVQTTGPASPATTEQVQTTGPASPATTEQVQTTGPASPATTEQVQTTGPASPATTEQVQTTGPASPATTEQVLTTGPTSAATTDQVETTNPASTATPDPSATSPGSPSPTPFEPSSDPTTVAPTTSEFLQCQNGGTFDGSKCLCTSGFNGKLCQFVEESVELENVEQLVKIQVVIDQEYNPNYDNLSSTEYLVFVKDFKDKMEDFYRRSNLSNFERLVVTKVSPAALPGLVRRSSSGVDQRRLVVDAMTAGRVTQRPPGINVSHDVVLIIPNNGDFESQYETQVNAVNKTLANLVTCTTDCPFNVTTQPTVTATEVDPKTFCMSYVKDPDLARHYRAVTHNNTLVCVTRCHANYDLDKLTCYNGGACRVFKDVGAVCECKALDATWYLGSNCGLPIKRVAFYAGLVVTLACLVATVSGLIAYVIINRKEQMRKKDVKKKLVNKWLNDEFEWSRSDKLSTDTLNAGHLNPSFPYDAPPRSPHTRQHTDYRQSGRSSPAVSMYRLDGAARGYDASIQHNGFPPSDQVQMRIHRPQIRSSWDV